MASKKKVKKYDFVGKIKKNPWKFATFIFAILSIVMMASMIVGESSNISSKKAGEGFVDYVNSMGESKIEYIDSQDFGLYEVTILAQGQKIPVHVTKNGKYYVPIDKGNMMPLSSQVVDEPEPEPTAKPQNSYSEDDLERISSTIQCLANSGVKIYGANWCGYTKAFVATLGGYDLIDLIYVECTENEELCSQEGIKGFPTTKINGQIYSGPRTFEGLSVETGCEAPKLEIESSASTASASC